MKKLTFDLFYIYFITSFFIIKTENIAIWCSELKHLVSVQFSQSVASTLSEPMDYSTPGLPVHYQLPEFTQTHVHWVGDAIQLSHSLSFPSPPTINLSQDSGLFQWVSSSYQVAKVLKFQLQYQCFEWIFRTDLFFRIDWLDALAVQGNLKSLLQHHSSKASILQCSTLFTVQFSHPYMTIEKTIALTRQTFVGKVMSLLLNMLAVSQRENNQG